MIIADFHFTKKKMISNALWLLTANYDLHKLTMVSKEQPRRNMMPLSMIGTGRSGMIRRISGPGSVRRFLAGLGFVEGKEVTVLSEMGGDVIVGILDSRVAINREMARHIYV